MDVETPRRRFLELAGTGTALSIAGCNALQNAQSDGGNGDGDGSATVTVAVEPDQQALQQRRSEIQSQFQNGNMSRSEAQQQLQTAQTELLTEASDAFRSTAEQEDALTIENSVSDLGVFLVSGAPAALIDTLDGDAVGALLPESSFQQALAQAGQQNGTANQTTNQTGG